MIEKFDSLENLYERIDNDLQSKRPSDIRYPVRFIFLESFEAMRKIVKYLSRSNSEIIELDSKLPNDDGWLTLDHIKDIINKGSNNDVTIVPLSEFLRFQKPNDFFALLKVLAEIEKSDTSNRRIYIPLVGLWEKFNQEFWDKFDRKNDWAPIWRIESSTEKITIYRINFKVAEIPIDKYMVTNTKEWFNFWKKESNQDIVSSSDTLLHFYENFLPDQIFNKKEINDFREYLEELFGIVVPVEFKADESHFWNKLIEAANKYANRGMSFKSLCLRHFNLMGLSELREEDYVRKYLEAKDEYCRWLIKNLFLANEDFQSTYLYEILGKVESFEKENLIELLWLHIFQLSQSKIRMEKFVERKKLLKFIHKELNLSFSSIENALSKEIKKIKNYSIKKQFDYLTNITFVERVHILELLKNVDISEHNTILMESYPELYYYLKWDILKYNKPIDPWILDYFKEYNLSKVKDSKSEKITQMINKKNADINSFSQWYFKIDKPELENDKCKIIWIDGMGAEWLSLFVHLIEEYGRERGRFVKFKALTTADLPTITECNKYEGKKINELDKYIHDENPYTYPKSLIEEIDVITNIAKKIVELPDKEICIVSDHGFSFLCLKKFGNFKKLDFEKANHEGRCMWVESEQYLDDPYFITWKIDHGHCMNKKVLIALTHTSLNNTPYREVHGGATPEEVFVPYLVIGTKTEKWKYEIKPKNFEIVTNNLTIAFEIFPAPQSIPKISMEGKMLDLIYDNREKVYKLKLNGLKTGDHLLILEIENKQYILKVKIKGGFKENNLGFEEDDLL